ncbi:MAG: hypothetical protein WEF86_15285 [Gemmatimonadota bacterium]
MHHYRLFGGTLRTDFAVPELQPAPPAAPTWTLTSAVGPPAAAEGELLGSETVTPQAAVHMFRRPTGFRLAFDDTGCFDISADGSAIHWTHAEDASIADARADLTSRVIAAALHAAGTLCLHGSAVLCGDEAIGFVAPKFHGKSTLALALVGAGAKLLTDDTLPIDPGPPAHAYPGLHSTRLWPDSASRVGIGTGEAPAGTSKQLFSALPDEHTTHAGHPLGAVYLLQPVRQPRGDDGAVVWRTRLPSVEAALVMIGHAKLAPLLAKSEAPALMRSAAAIAASVPVYRLSLVRDLDRLDEVVATVRAWHSCLGASVA